MVSLGGLPVTKAKDSVSYYNHLIYGPSGVGKTRLVGSASLVDELKPVLFLDVEGGILSLRDIFPEIDVIRIVDTEKKMAWEHLADVFEKIWMGVEYRTIILDSLSEAHGACMAWILKQSLKSDPSRDPDIPTQRDWGKASALITKLVRGLRDAPYNVLMTTLETQIKDKDSVMYTAPGLPGKLAPSIPGIPDVVSYLYIKASKTGEVERRLLSQPIEKYLVKDRTDTLPLVMTNPTMVEVYGYISKRSESND